MQGELEGITLVRIVDGKNQYLQQLRDLIRDASLDTPERLHAFSREFMGSPRFANALAIAMMREFRANGVKPTLIMGFEKRAGHAVGFASALAFAPDGLNVALEAVLRRKPEESCWEEPFQPKRFREPLTGYLPKTAFNPVGQNTVIFVDDIMDSGSTMEELYKLTWKARLGGLDIVVGGFAAIVARKAAIDRLNGMLLKPGNEPDRNVPLVIIEEIQ